MKVYISTKKSKQFSVYVDSLRSNASKFKFNIWFESSCYVDSVTIINSEKWLDIDIDMGVVNTDVLVM